jgi:hypothetical protein
MKNAGGAAGDEHAVDFGRHFNPPAGGVDDRPFLGSG